MLNKNSGFSVIGLLAIIGIFGILLAVFLIAVNPTSQFVKANNTARKVDVTILLDAIHQFSIDNKGKLPANMPAKGAAAVLIQGTGGADICADISPKYIAELPIDPSSNVPVVNDCTDKTYKTSYSVSVDATGRVTVSAADAEAQGGAMPAISVTR